MAISTAVSGFHDIGLLGAMIQGQRAETACRSSLALRSAPSPPPTSAESSTRSQRTRAAARGRIGDFAMLDSLVAGNQALARSRRTHRDAAPAKPRDAEQESVYSTSSFSSTRVLLKKTLSGWKK